MNDRITAGAAAVMGTLVAATAAVRWAVTPGRPVTEDDLLGPPTAYTTNFEHAPAPIRSGFGNCPACGRTTAGVLNKDGWLCGEFSNHPAGGAS